VAFDSLERLLTRVREKGIADDLSGQSRFAAPDIAALAGMKR